MIEDIQNLLDKYSEWLKDQTKLRQIDKDWIEITTPYLDRHNDYLQLYVKQQNNGFIITDDSYIIHDLEMSGCNLNIQKRQALLEMTLNGFGIKRNKDALEINATRDDFHYKKHNLLQAMLAVNDLFYLAAPFVKSLFYEDVEAWLNLNKIRYTPGVSFLGKTGYVHRFNFVIPKSDVKPERILNTINSPRRNTAQSMIFSWMDTKGTRPPDSKAYAILNDSEKEVPATIIGALKNHDVEPVPWSKREAVKDELAA